MTKSFLAMTLPLYWNISYCWTSCLGSLTPLVPFCRLPAFGFLAFVISFTWGDGPFDSLLRYCTYLSLPLWSGKWIGGWCCFCNYKHIIQTSIDDQWVDGGPYVYQRLHHNSERGAGWQNWQRNSCYLDVVHIDIVFRYYIAPSGFCCTLIIFDRATHYNRVFGLKDLSRNLILSAFHLFWANADSYAWCFWLDWDTKLFGSKICKHLIHSDFIIIAAVACHQSANGLVELHWKVMVYMPRAYLTKK